MNKIVKFSNTRIYIWVIIILIVLNISTIGTIFYHNYKVENFRKLDQKNYPVQRTPKFFHHQEHFYGDRSDKHVKYINEYRSEARILAKKMQEKRVELLNHLSSDTTDTTYLNNLASEFGDLHRDLKLLTIDFYLKTKAVSTPEQQEELFHYFNYLLKKGDMHGRKTRKPHKRMKREEYKQNLRNKQK